MKEMLPFKRTTIYYKDDQMEYCAEGLVEGYLSKKQVNYDKIFHSFFVSNENAGNHTEKTFKNLLMFLKEAHKIS
jgi:hypothetical protein